MEYPSFFELKKNILKVVLLSFLYKEDRYMSLCLSILLINQDFIDYSQKVLLRMQKEQEALLVLAKMHVGLCHLLIRVFNSMFQIQNTFLSVLERSATMFGDRFSLAQRSTSLSLTLASRTLKSCVSASVYSATFG